MLLVEENHVRAKSKMIEGKMFFSYSNGGQDEVVAAKEVDSAHLMKGTQTFMEEPSKEGGASIRNKVGKHYHSPATIVGRSAIAKRSVERKDASQLPQADNSQTTPPMPIVTTMVDYL